MPIKKKGSFDLKKSIAKFRREKGALPNVLGNMAKNHFLEGFRTGGGQTDAGVWVPRKKQDSGRALLVKSGILRKSIKLELATFALTKISSLGVKYAEPHNTGLDPQPKREFIGESRVLASKLQRKITLEIRNVFPK